MGRPRHAPEPRNRSRLRLGGAIASLWLAGMTPAVSAEPLLDLNQRALAWSAGEFIAPLVCEFPHGVKRGVRKLRVSPGPRHLRPPVARLSFPGMDLPEGTTCTNDTGTAQPNVTGSVLYRLEAISRPDIADHEFSEALERDGGFTFDIREGVLDVSGEKIDFKGGHARFRRVVPGTDAYRRLQDIPGLRKLALTLTAPDGTELLLDLAQGPPSRRPR